MKVSETTQDRYYVPVHVYVCTYARLKPLLINDTTIHFKSISPPLLIFNSILTGLPMRNALPSLPRDMAATPAMRPALILSGGGDGGGGRGCTG